MDSPVKCLPLKSYQGNVFKALVYQHMVNGSLDECLHPHLEEHTVHEMPENLNLLQRVNIAIDVASVLDYLHQHCQKPIVHCYLKPSNFLLDNEMNAHVSDFRLAKFLLEWSNRSSVKSIIFCWSARICWLCCNRSYDDREVSTSGGVYSMGSFPLLEMMTGKRPTDPMFGEGFNLHNFARMALVNRVKPIIEPLLLKNDEENTPSAIDKDQSERWERYGNIKEHCLISTMKIGVACSMESLHDRMDIRNVVDDLNLVRDLFQQT